MTQIGFKGIIKCFIIFTLSVGKSWINPNYWNWIEIYKPKCNADAECNADADADADADAEWCGEKTK